MRRRGRRRGLMGAAARTAVIAGTATAVSGKVARAKGAAHQREGAADDRIAKLERLTKLRESGALTEEEFQREKSKLPG